MYDYRKAFRALDEIEWKTPGLVIPCGTPVAIIGNAPLGILAFGATCCDSYAGEFRDDGFWTEFGRRESELNRDRQKEFVRVRLSEYAAGANPRRLRGSVQPGTQPDRPIANPIDELVSRRRMANEETIEIDVSAAQDGSELFRADAGEAFMARKINCRRAIATWLDRGAFLRLIHLR